jgi:hypothetical protein
LDKAFELAGRHFRGLDNPNQAAFYTSGRLSNEATFLYQLFARELGPRIFRIARTCVTRQVAERSALGSAPEKGRWTGRENPRENADSQPIAPHTFFQTALEKEGWHRRSQRTLRILSLCELRDLLCKILLISL